MPTFTFTPARKFTTIDLHNAAKVAIKAAFVAGSKHILADRHGDMGPTLRDAQSAIEAAMPQGFVITIYNNLGQQEAETAEALYLPDECRLGIAWGADATWATVDDVESGIEMWLNDPEAWEAAN